MRVVPVILTQMGLSRHGKPGTDDEFTIKILRVILTPVIEAGLNAVRVNSL